MENNELPKSTLTGLHAIAYCRVSTDDKGQTVTTQKRLIQEWADRLGVVIDNVYSDVGKSGDLYPRPGLSMAIVELNASPTASILVSYDESRLSRNGAEDLPKIKTVLKQGAQIRFTVYGDEDPDNLGIRITTAVKGVTDNAELKKLSARTIAGMKTRKDAGKHMGRPAKVVITDDPDSLPAGLVQARDGTRTAGTPEEMAEDRQRQYSGYDRGTKVLTKREVLNYARMGWTPYKVAKILGISEASFIRIMSDERVNIYSEYRLILNQTRGAGA